MHVWGTRIPFSCMQMTSFSLLQMKTKHRQLDIMSERCQKWSMRINAKNHRSFMFETSRIQSQRQNYTAVDKSYLMSLIANIWASS